jgi:hypothetical protein
MSYRPTIGGRLRKGTSGVDRSQAALFCWGIDPVKEIGQTCGLNVIMRRKAIWMTGVPFGCTAAGTTQRE